MLFAEDDGVAITSAALLVCCNKETGDPLKALLLGCRPCQTDAAASHICYANGISNTLLLLAQKATRQKYVRNVD